MRTYGAKNADHEAKRQRMVAQISPLIVRAAPSRPSLREMAKAADVSVNNLRHYFGTREGVLQAVFEAMGKLGGPYVERALAYTELSPREGLTRLLRELVAAWVPERLAGLHHSGISEGLGSPVLGPIYVENLLEPTLAVVETMLSSWAGRGELELEDPRAAALALFGPVLVGLLHQRGLGGAGCRPLDLDAFVETHVSGWLSGYAAK